MPDEPPPSEPARLTALFELVYEHLRAIATLQLEHLPPGNSLSPTILVHEAFLRLKAHAGEWDDRKHFLNAAAQAMRHIAVDHARAKTSLKRGGPVGRVSLADDLVLTFPVPDDVLDLNEALDALAVQSEPAARVVVLRCFAGAEWADVALAMGLSLRKVKSLWKFAQAWLFRRLQPGRA